MTDKAVALANSPAVSFEQMQRMATSIAKSNLFGVKDSDQALALMLIAVAEGHSPALVARDFHIIQNRPAKKAEAMMRDFQSAGGSIKWNKLDDTVADATFSHPKGGTITISWDMKRAEQAGLTKKDGSMYNKYPRAMLRSRVVSEGVRTVWPGATSGMYTPEEAHDIAEEIDVTPPKTAAELDKAMTAAVAEVTSGTALTKDEVDAHSDAMDKCTTLPELQQAYLAGHEHCKVARDNAAKRKLDEVYRLLSEELVQKATQS